MAPILVAYDGSEHARHTVERAGEIFPSHPAIVLHAWEPVELGAIRRATSGLSTFQTKQEIDSGADEVAARKAAEGVALARRAGLTADALSRRWAWPARRCPHARRRK